MQRAIAEFVGRDSSPAADVHVGLSARTAGPGGPAHRVRGGHRLRPQGQRRRSPEENRFREGFMEVTLFISVGTTAIRPELGTTRDDYRKLQKDIADFKRRADSRAATELAALHADALFVDVVQAHAEVLLLGPVDVESASLTSAEMRSEEHT